MSNWIRNPCSRAINTGIFDKMKYPCQTGLTMAFCGQLPFLLVETPNLLVCPPLLLFVKSMKIPTSSLFVWPSCIIYIMLLKPSNFADLSPSLKSIFSPFPWPFWITFVASSPFSLLKLPFFLAHQATPNCPDPFATSPWPVPCPQAPPAQHDRMHRTGRCWPR